MKFEKIKKLFGESSNTFKWKDNQISLTSTLYIDDILSEFVIQTTVNNKFIIGSTKFDDLSEGKAFVEKSVKAAIASGKYKPPVKKSVKVDKFAIYGYDKTPNKKLSNVYSFETKSDWIENASKLGAVIRDASNLIAKDRGELFGYWNTNLNKGYLALSDAGVKYLGVHLNDIPKL